MLLGRPGFVLAALTAAALLLRLAWLTADFPAWISDASTTVGDEGFWTHNARNAARTGHVFVDFFNPVMVSPAFTALVYGSFKLFGVGFWPARLPNALMGALSAPLAFALLRRGGAGRAAAWSAAGLLGLNFFYVMYNRAALLDTGAGFFLLLAAYLWVRGAEAGSGPLWSALSGAAFAAACLVKTSAAFFLGVMVFAWIVERRRARASVGWAQEEPPRPLWFILGLCLMAGVWALAFAQPHLDQLARHLWFYSLNRFPVLQHPGRELLHLVPVRSALRFPELTGLAGLYCLLLLPSWLEGRRQASRAEVIAFGWAGLGALSIWLGTGNFPANHYQILLLPALALVGGILLGELVSGRCPRPDVRLARPGGTAVVWLIGAYLVVSSAWQLLEEMPSWPAHLFVVLLISAAAIAASWLLWHGLYRRPAVAALVASALILALNLGFYLNWAATRRYTVVAAAGALAQRVGTSRVAGRWAHVLSLSGAFQPIGGNLYHAVGFRYQEALAGARPRFLLLQEDEHYPDPGILRATCPELMAAATPVAEYRFLDCRNVLYEVRNWPRAPGGG